MDSIQSQKNILVQVLFHFILQYASLKPLGDRVLVKIKGAEKCRRHDNSAKQGVNWCQDWYPVVYSKYAGTEVEFNGSNHLILKEDDIVGILEIEDVTDLKSLDDRVPIKGEEAEETTRRIAYTSKQRKTLYWHRPGPLDDEGNTVLYSKYAGNNFKGTTPLESNFSTCFSYSINLVGFYFKFSFPTNSGKDFCDRVHCDWIKSSL
ncbi:unnamed protein product [Lactuca virosa]|uniref:ASCH domain-containing protein n=1 Tax=Lactuca virosa TaxID=75947 RepID=A0AAU9NLN2_9ASTR|nr:unnamed protein product [Lactuca virosa]